MTRQKLSSSPLEPAPPKGGGRGDTRTGSPVRANAEGDVAQSEG